MLGMKMGHPWDPQSQKKDHLHTHIALCFFFFNLLYIVTLLSRVKTYDTPSPATALVIFLIAGTKYLTELPLETYFL